MQLSNRLIVMMGVSTILIITKKTTFITSMKINKVIALSLGMAVAFQACNQDSNEESEIQPELEMREGGDGPYGFESEIGTISQYGKTTPTPMFEWLETSESNFVPSSTPESRTTSNPNGLAVAIHSPYNGTAETTTTFWGPPQHSSYWGGDWAGDFWKDNGNSSADYGNSCNQDIYLDARIVTYPGGQTADAIKAKYLSYGYACASGVYSQGGMVQKWELLAVKNGVEVAVGWVLFAHLTNSPVYAVGTTLTLNGRVKIGSAFTGGTTGSCWGSCHIHMEFLNYERYSCYDVNLPTVNASRIGVLGGFASSKMHCPTLTSGGGTTNWALSAISCNRSSAYSSAYDCAKARDGVSSQASKWVTDGASRTSWMTMDLGANRNISQFVVKHAGAVGEPAISNLKYYQLQTAPSNSGPWTTVVNVNNSAQANSTTHNVSLNARYVAILVTDPGVDNYTRLVEFEVRGN